MIVLCEPVVIHIQDDTKDIMISAMSLVSRDTKIQPVVILSESNELREQSDLSQAGFKDLFGAPGSHLEGRAGMGRQRVPRCQPD